MSFLSGDYHCSNNPFQSATRHTRADQDGHYGLDTSDLSLVPCQQGRVVASDEAGNQVERFFQVAGFRQILPLLAVKP